MLEVNTTTGKMSIFGATQLTGYEITSAASSLAPVSLEVEQPRCPKLRASCAPQRGFQQQQLGRLCRLYSSGGSRSAPPQAAMRMETESPTSWTIASGDSSTAKALAAGESWETLIGTNKQLLEFYLSGSSTFGSRSIGAGYNTAIDARDLTFKYSMANGQEFVGIVRYVSGAGLGSSTVSRAHILRDTPCGDSVIFALWRTTTIKFRLFLNWWGIDRCQPTWLATRVVDNRFAGRQ